MVGSFSVHDILVPISLIYITSRPLESAFHFLVVFELSFKGFAIIPSQLAPTVFESRVIRLALEIGERGDGGIRVRPCVFFLNALLLPFTVQTSTSELCLVFR